MPRIGLVNIVIGFCVILLSASAGTFIAFDMTEMFLRNSDQVHSWQATLMRSAHGHFNLFGFIHVMLGVTLPYSLLPRWCMAWQTVGLFLGTLSMGPGLVLRAYQGPTESLDALGLGLGLGMSLALIAIATHAFGVFARLAKRQ